MEKTGSGKEEKEKAYPPLLIKNKSGCWELNPEMNLWKSAGEGEPKPDECPVCRKCRFSRTPYLGNVNYKCEECGYTIHYQDTDYRFFDT